MSVRLVTVSQHVRRVPAKASDLAFERTTFALQCFVVGKECERELEQSLSGISRDDIERLLETY